MIDQLTVFLENKPGRLVALTRRIGDAGISMRALMVADTTEFGVIRIICDAPEYALELLREEGYSCALTKVIAVEVADVPGSFADALEVLEKENINVEYAYCFFTGRNDQVVNVLKVETSKMTDAAAAFRKASYRIYEPQDIYCDPQGDVLGCLSKEDEE